MKVIVHPNVRISDLPSIQNDLGEEAFLSFLDLLDHELTIIRRNPVHNGSAACEFPPLLNYRKKKFFSSPQIEGDKPDMRLVYRYDDATNTLYLLGIGKQIKTRPVDPQDVYQIMKTRDQALLDQNK